MTLVIIERPAGVWTQLEADTVEEVAALEARAETGALNAGAGVLMKDRLRDWVLEAGFPLAVVRR